MEMNQQARQLGLLSKDPDGRSFKLDFQAPGQLPLALIVVQAAPGLRQDKQSSAPVFSLLSAGGVGFQQDGSSSHMMDADH